MTLNNYQLQRRKKAQAGISLAGAALGITALGAKGTGAAARRIAPYVTDAKRAHQLYKVPKRTDKIADDTGVAALGVGGIGGINFASIQAAEAKKVPRVRKPIKKAYQPKLNKKQQRKARQISGGVAIGGAVTMLATHGRGNGRLMQIASANRNNRYLREPLPVKPNRKGVYDITTEGNTKRAMRYRRAYTTAAGATAGGAVGAGVPDKDWQYPLGKPKRKAIKKNFEVEHMDFGLGGVRQSEEISKLGGPKVKGHATSYLAYDADSKQSTSLSPNQFVAAYRGKSAILRRPKYEANYTADPRKLPKGKNSSYYGHTQRVRFDKTTRNDIHSAYQGRKKKLATSKTPVRFEKALSTSNPTGALKMMSSVAKPQKPMSVGVPKMPAPPKPAAAAKPAIRLPGQGLSRPVNSQMAGRTAGAGTATSATAPRVPLSAPRKAAGGMSGAASGGIAKAFSAGPGLRKVGRGIKRVHESPRTTPALLGLIGGMEYQKHVVNRVDKPKKGVSKAFSAEGNRKKRLNAYGDAGLVAGGALGVAGASSGFKAGQALKGIRGTKTTAGKRVPVTNAALGRSLRAAGPHAGRAGLLVGASGAALYGSKKVRQYARSKGNTYSPMRAIGY